MTNRYLWVNFRSIYETIFELFQFQLKGGDFKFDSLKEFKTCSRSTFKLLIDTWQIDLLRVVTFIDMSAPCSADSLKIFKELSKLLGQMLLRWSLPHHPLLFILERKVSGGKPQFYTQIRQMSTQVPAVPVACPAKMALIIF